MPGLSGFVPVLSAQVLTSVMVSPRKSACTTLLVFAVKCFCAMVATALCPLNPHDIKPNDRPIAATIVNCFLMWQMYQTQ
jgi:hypothetical protein